jgi:hypothetical protein
MDGGKIFRSIKKGGKLGDWLTAHSVAEIVKIHAERVGLDPQLFSLRAGFLTSAAKRGASIFKMMDVSRRRSVETPRRRAIPRPCWHRSALKWSLT